MDGVVGEEVARHVERNREWTQIYANLCERDRLAAPKRNGGGPGRCGARLATRSEMKDRDRDVFGETPNTAVETTALPTHQISAATMQMEDRNRQKLRQDLQDEQDRLPIRGQSPNGQALFLMPIFFSDPVHPVNFLAFNCMVPPQFAWMDVHPRFYAQVFGISGSPYATR
jgi:hypothetical protein